MMKKRKSMDFSNFWSQSKLGFSKVFIYLRDKERESKLSHLLIQSPDAYSGWIWVKPNKEA